MVGKMYYSTWKLEMKMEIQERNKLLSARQDLHKEDDT